MLSLLIGVPILADIHLKLVPYMETVIPDELQIPVPQSTSGYVFPWEGSEAKGFAAGHV